MLAYWRRQQAQSESGLLPGQNEFRPRHAAPQAADFMGLIDVTSEDLNEFSLLTMGSEAVGLHGFNSMPLLNPVVDRIHCTLLIDLLWAKMDRQPAYIETEIIVDEATVRYVHCFLPTHGSGGTVEQVHVVTRPVLGARVALEALF